MEKSPGTWTVSMFGGCWLTGIASGSSLINSSSALRRCLTYLQHSAVVVQVSLSLSLSDVPPLSFVQTTWNSNTFSCILDHHSILYRSGFGRISISGSLVWLQMACPWIPLLAFWVTLQYLSCSSSTLIHWVTWRKSVRFACVLLNVCPGLRVWSSSLTLSEFVCEKKCKRRSEDMAKISFLGLGRSQCQTLFRSDHSMTDSWRNLSNYAKSLWHPRGKTPTLAFQILWLHRCNFFLC